MTALIAMSDLGETRDVATIVAEMEVQLNAAAQLGGPKWRCVEALVDLLQAYCRVAAAAAQEEDGTPSFLVGASSKARATTAAVLQKVQELLSRARAENEIMLERAYAGMNVASISFYNVRVQRIASVLDSEDWPASLVAACGGVAGAMLGSVSGAAAGRQGTDAEAE